MITCISALILFLSGFVKVFAEDPIKTVKVGYFAFPGYHQLENGVRSGYGYDFLLMLQRYTHLNFEYVGYENSWEEMQKMLLDGRVDFVTSARKTIEREKLYDFSMPIGVNSAQINVRMNDDHFIPGDFAALNGITIGILSGNSRNADLEKFAIEKGFTYKTKEYASVKVLQQALAAGQVDAIATSSLRRSSFEKTIAEFAPQRFYVIVRKGNRALLNEINYGISQMDANEGNWRDNLYFSNYGARSGSILSFTQRELDYIRAVYNGEKKITVTARPDRNPYSFAENGKLVGIIPDYFAKLMERSGLTYTVLIPDNREEYGKWFAARRVNVFIDYRYDSSQPWSDDSGMFTGRFMELTLARITRKGFSGEARVVARIKDQPDKDLLAVGDGTKDFITVDSAESALKAVKRGKADVCYVPTFIAEKFINADITGNLTYSILKEPTYYATMFIRPDTDHELCSILNKCIRTERAGTLSEFISKYTAVSFDNLSLAQYLKLHPWFAFWVVLITMLLILHISFMKFGKKQRSLLEVIRGHLRRLLEVVRKIMAVS